MIAPASKLLSLVLEEMLIEFLKTVLLIEFAVALRVCKKAERFSAMVSYIRQDAFSQHPAAEPLTLQIWFHSQQIQIPGLSTKTLTGTTRLALHVIPCRHIPDTALKKTPSKARPHIRHVRRLLIFGRTEHGHGQNYPILFGSKKSAGPSLIRTSISSIVPRKRVCR